MILTTKTVPEIIRELENSYLYGTGNQISEYVNFNLFRNINQIEAYINATHISGSTDALGRDKPFFDIVNGAVNIWYKATDINRNKIKILASSSDEDMAAFLATIKLQEYMNRENFGVFLNTWGMTKARYCTAVSKFVPKGKRLVTTVVPWNRIICDSVDFYNNPKIEVLYYTPAQLKMNENYDQDMIDSMLDSLVSRQTLRGLQTDNKPDYIKVYEIHGKLPLSLITGNDRDDDVFQQQMHVICYMARTDGHKDQYDDFTLYKGREKKDPYMIHSLIDEEGRIMGKGAVELLFQHQWMVNHSMKAIKDQLDLSSKLFFQTADGSFAGRNATQYIETGDILVHNGSPITQVENDSHDVSSLLSYAGQWRDASQDTTSTPDALRGNNPHAGTAYRLQQLVTNQSQSLFELMRQNKGLAIEEMMREQIIPFIKTQLDNSDEIAAVLEDHQITKIDSAYLPKEAIKASNEKLKTMLLNNEDMSHVNKVTQQQDIQNETNKLQSSLSTLGSTRYIKPSDISSTTWKDIFKDFEWKCNVDVTGESVDSEAVLTTLQTMLTTMANPATAPFLQTPQGKFLFNKIMENVGIVSPIELSQFMSQPAQPPQQSQPPQPPQLPPGAPQPQAQPSPVQSPQQVGV